MGEFAYDYVGLDAELGAGLPHSSSGPGGANADVHALGATGGGREPSHAVSQLPREKRDSSSEGEAEKPTA